MTGKGYTSTPTTYISGIQRSTVYLVSCVSTKRPSPVEARHLYRSPWFTKAKLYVEGTGCPWFILSAKHGLIPPDQVIAPYELSLTTMSVDDRRRWFRLVTGQMSKLMPHPERVVFLAGARYREGLIEYLQKRGVIVEAPMKGLRIGEQIRWLGRCNP